MSVGLAAFKLSFEICPIILTNGIAQNIPGGALPIIAITEPANAVTNLLSGSFDLNLNNYFAHFAPMPGSTLGENQAAQYPSANQAVAANALIAQPLTISMLMICPARGEGGYAAKFVTMLALKSILNQHDGLGGTYIVATPSGFYDNCIRLRLSDVSSANSHQAQNAYQWDFFRPLLTLEAAQQSQNSLMSKLSNGTQVNGDPTWSGSASTVGQPASLASPSVVPAGSSAAGTGVAPLTPVFSTPLAAPTSG